MAKVTLGTILEELKKRDAKEDTRFEFLKEQIQSNHAEAQANHAEAQSNYAELKAEARSNHSEARSNHAELKAEMKAEFTQVRKELKIIRDQTAHLTERVTALEHAEKESSPS